MTPAQATPPPGKSEPRPAQVPQLAQIEPDPVPRWLRPAGRQLAQMEPDPVPRWLRPAGRQLAQIEPDPVPGP